MGNLLSIRQGLQLENLSIPYFFLISAFEAFYPHQIVAHDDIGTGNSHKNSRIIWDIDSPRECSAETRILRPLLNS